MEIHAIAVLGAGTMGAGIAQVAAQAGYRVHLRDLSSDLLDRARAAIEANIEKAIDLKKLRDDERTAALSRLHSTVHLAEAVRDSDLVIEAVPEDFFVKAAVFEDTSRHAPRHALFATNTSALSVSALASRTDRPERVVGMHFFNPVHLMKLLELVAGDETAGETIEAARAVAERMGKQVIVVKDSPGFATSRLGVLLGLEAIRMLEAGVARAEDIDTAMTLGYGHPMGPLRLTDLVGLDVRLKIARHLHTALGSEAFRPPALLERMVEEGKLGRKTGRGFYDWS